MLLLAKMLTGIVLNGCPLLSNEVAFTTLVNSSSIIIHGAEKEECNIRQMSYITIYILVEHGQLLAN